MSWEAKGTAGANSWNDPTSAISNGDVSGGYHFTSQDARFDNGGFHKIEIAASGFGGEGGGAVAGGDGCRNCGQEGHFARECPQPRKGGGACFNCGEDGHSKAECPNPRKFTGECRTCGQTGHPAKECPERQIICKQCQQEGHEALECKNLMILNLSHIPDKTIPDAWKLLKQASDEREIGEFKEAVQILSKAMPELTYPQLEKELRKRSLNVFIIAMEKDHGPTLTNVNMQGETSKKYTVFYFLSDKVQRPSMKERWPANADENMERLADCGVPVDRGIPLCSNCNELGHIAKACTAERQEVERASVTCALCNEAGHRVRDCTQERRKERAPRECNNCSSTEHISKDCPEPKPCRNCDERGHEARDCTAPKDWSRVKCRRCGENGHTVRKCPMPDSEAGAGENAGDGFSGDNAGFGGDSGCGDNTGVGVGEPTTGGDDWTTPSAAPGSSGNNWEAPSAPVASTASGW